MYGRGYVNDGCNKAAAYLAGEFRKMGLDSISDGYYQLFDIPINTFPYPLQLTVDGVSLKPGVDYLVSANSGSAFGTFDLVYYDRNNLPERKYFNKLVKKRFFNEKVIAIDRSGIEDHEVTKAIIENYFGSPAIIILHDKKLTWSSSIERKDFGILEVNSTVITRKSKKVKLEIKNKFVSEFQTKNVIGYVKGKSQPDSFIVMMGHYDHLGMMGEKAMFRGANDNASGIAMVMNMARHYVKHPHRYSMLFICFGAEESGIIGSYAFHRSAVVDPRKIKFYFNFDILGTGEDGIKVVNATKHVDEFIQLEEIHKKQNILKAVEKRGAAANSDHYFFHKAGVTGFYIYTLGGSRAYHDIYDTPENLTLSGFPGIYKLVTTFLDDL